jgi:hypothetical protein
MVLLLYISRKEGYIVADVVKVSPTPIQRNRLDVAMELTQLQRGLHAGSLQKDDIETTFAKYYALATFCEGATHEELEQFVSEEIKSKFARAY